MSVICTLLPLPMRESGVYCRFSLQMSDLTRYYIHMVLSMWPPARSSGGSQNRHNTTARHTIHNTHSWVFCFPLHDDRDDARRWMTPFFHEAGQRQWTTTSDRDEWLSNHPDVSHTHELWRQWTIGTRERSLCRIALMNHGAHLTHTHLASRCTMSAGLHLWIISYTISTISKIQACVTPTNNTKNECSKRCD